MSAPTEKIHFLDISSKLPGYRQSWSPNTLKTRLLLNAMDVPYTEQYVSYPDIAPMLSSYGVPPNSSGFTYTLPAIYHPESLEGKTPGGKILSESVDIARQLDALFPDAPAHAFPEPKDASEALWKESEDLMRKMVFVQEGGHGYKLLMPRIPPILDDRGAEHFIRTRKAAHKDNKSPLEWGSPNAEDDWEAMKPSVIAYNEYHLAHSRSASNPGPFLLGETVSMGDIYLASIVVWFQAAGGDEFVERFLGMGEGEEWEKSPIRGVWEEFEKRGWLTGQGEAREIPARCE